MSQDLVIQEADLKFSAHTEQLKKAGARIMVRRRKKYIRLNKQQSEQLLDSSLFKAALHGRFSGSLAEFLAFVG